MKGENNMDNQLKELIQKEIERHQSRINQNQEMIKKVVNGDKGLGSYIYAIEKYSDEIKLLDKTVETYYNVLSIMAFLEKEQTNKK
jgi:hypothetical protein